MSLLAAVATLFIPTINAVPATAHERAFQTKVEKVAASDLPLSIWQADGIHRQSTLTCPAKVGNFERITLTPFDNFGFDVGCNFDYRGEARITLYLTRRKGGSLADDLQIAKDALKQNMTSAQLIDGASAAPTGLAFQGSIYAVSGTIRTAVWVADVSGWTMKFRATYRSENEADVVATMTTLTDGAKRTAVTHLAACAAAPAVTRDGKEVTDKTKMMSLSLTAMMGEASDDLDDKAAKPAAEQWCAEEALGDQETPMLFWRNIANASNAGAADRVSLMTMGEPPILLSVGNPVAGLVQTDLTGDGGLIYQFTARQGTTSFVFAFFAGRPSSTALAPIAKDVFLDKRGALTSYDSKSKTITIPSSS
jgi:hypothetical protein